MGRVYTRKFDWDEARARHAAGETQASLARVYGVTINAIHRVERHKVPCVGCGKPALPPNEKSTGGIDRPRCRECMYASHRLPEQREAARQRALASLGNRQ